MPLINKLLSYMKYSYSTLSIIIYGSIFFFLGIVSLNAQIEPGTGAGTGGVVLAPRKANISVSLTRGLVFGNFITGANGGSVTVTSTGGRSSTGSVVLLPTGLGSQAIFAVTLDRKSNVSWIVTSIVDLSNGKGNTLRLTVNSFYPVSPASLQYGINNVNVGGTITVGSPAVSPPGSYTGSFSITFNVE